MAEGVSQPAQSLSRGKRARSSTQASTPPRRKAPALEVQRILRLYRERFAGWNVRHFYRFARRDHAVTLSYSFVKLALQEAGLVRRARARGRHRRRREPRACFGELLHLPLKTAIATSLVCAGVFALPATVVHAILGDVDWRVAALLTIGVVPGARLGAGLTIRAAERRLRLAVSLFLAVVAVVYFVTEARALLGEL